MLVNSQVSLKMGNSGEKPYEPEIIVPFQKIYLL
jgi:hypothetical protein